MAGKLHLIDSDKFKTFVNSWGGATAVGYLTQTSHDCVTHTIRRGSITTRLIDKIEEAFGVPYDMYKKVEEEPPKEEVSPKIALPEMSNDDFKQFACFLREICNNQLAIYKRLNHLTGVGTRLEDEIIKMREKVEKL